MFILCQGETLAYNAANIRTLEVISYQKKWAIQMEDDECVEAIIGIYETEELAKKALFNMIRVPLDEPIQVIQIPL